MTRNVVILAPMPLELDAIVTAFSLEQTGDGWKGTVGDSNVRAVHIGMAPPSSAPPRRSCSTRAGSIT